MYSFIEIKDKIFEWYENNFEELEDTYIDFVKNNDEILHIGFDFKHSIGEILVHKPDYAPYKFISIQLITNDTVKCKNGESYEHVYCFYDTDETKENEVIEALNSFIKMGENSC